MDMFTQVIIGIIACVFAFMVVGLILDIRRTDPAKDCRGRGAITMARYVEPNTPAQAKAWLGYIYNARGFGMDEDTWAEFARWCEENDYTDELRPPGKCTLFGGNVRAQLRHYIAKAGRRAT